MELNKYCTYFKQAQLLMLLHLGANICYFSLANKIFCFKISYKIFEMTVLFVYMLPLEC